LIKRFFYRLHTAFCGLVFCGIVPIMFISATISGAIKGLTDAGFFDTKVHLEFLRVAYRAIVLGKAD